MMIVNTDNDCLFATQSRDPYEGPNDCQTTMTPEQAGPKKLLTPHDYFLAQSEIILMGVGFHCIPFSQDGIFLQKEAYIWHCLIKELVDGRGHSLPFLVRATEMDKKSLELLHARPCEHIKLSIKAKRVVLFLHQQ